MFSNKYFVLVKCSQS